MRQSRNIRSLFGLFAVLSFLVLNPLVGQQKIQIKEGTADVGHFSVELLHNKPGAPMKPFSGNGGTINVDGEDNNFILRLRNLVWFDVDNEMDLVIDINMISPRTSCDISFDNEGRKMYFKPIPALVTDIPFSVSGTGSVKMVVPFTYLAGEGRFFQEFTISTAETKKETRSTFASKKDERQPTLSSKEARRLWDNVDKESFIEVAGFAVKYKNEKRATRYVKEALELATELSDSAQKKSVAREEAKPKSGNAEKVENSEVVNEIDLTDLDQQTEILEDIAEVVENLEGEEVSDGVLTLEMTVEGGEEKKIDVHVNEMPLQVNLFRLGEKQHDLINTVPIDKFQSDSSFVLDLGLLKSLKLSGDFSKYTVTNAYGTEIEKGALSITTDEAGGNSLLWIMLLITAVVFGFGAFVFISRSRKEKQRQKNKKIIAAKMQENRDAELKSSNNASTSQSTGQISAAAGSTQKKQKIKIGGKKLQSASPKIVPPVGAVKRSVSGKSRIVIRSKKKSGLPIEFAAFSGLVNDSKAVPIDLGEIWSDSRIDKMYLTPQFINELDTFLADSSNEGIQNELQGAVPEVGGFLMGRYTEQQSSLEVLVEKFVPFVPEYNDVFKIEIGTKTIVEELGDAQDKNPEQEVIGWFHTHPGHGLFLSTSDLSVHRHFPNDYQVAMEIDSLTQGLDMSFFTRKSTGKMNNSNDRNEGAGWFQWIDIENTNVS